MFKIKSWIPQTTTLLYVILLILHVLHSHGERRESASFITTWYKNYRTYSTLEILFFTAAMIIFILYLIKVKWSYYLAMSYFVIMIIDGLYHVISITMEGKSFGSNVVSITTSIGFIIIGIALIKSLWKSTSG